MWEGRQWFNTWPYCFFLIGIRLSEETIITPLYCKQTRRHSVCIALEVISYICPSELKPLLNSQFFSSRSFFFLLIMLNILKLDGHSLEALSNWCSVVRETVKIKKFLKWVLIPLVRGSKDTGSIGRILKHKPKSCILKPSVYYFSEQQYGRRLIAHF